MARELELCPVDLEEANAFVERHHRHHGEVPGYKFALGAVHRGEIIGVAVIGRPVARRRQDGMTLELTRLCVVDPEPIVTDRRGKTHPLGVGSFLYGAAARASLALGYRRIGTYILKSEPGASLKAAGWKLMAETPGRSWSVPSRPRVDKHPLEPRLLFEAGA